MASEAIVVTSGKGGVGKTTLTANLAAALALEGCRTVAVDADLGLKNLDLMMGMQDRAVYDILDVADGRVTLSEALIESGAVGGLALLPASQTNGKSSITPERFRAVMLGLKDRFDYVIIDCPAGIDRGFINAVAGADRALVTAMCDLVSTRDAEKVTGILRSCGMQDIRLVINRFDPALAREAETPDIDDMIDSVAARLIGVVPYDRRVISCQIRGEFPVLCSKSVAGMAIRNIAARLLGRKVPLLRMSGLY